MKYIIKFYLFKLNQYGYPIIQENKTEILNIDNIDYLCNIRKMIKLKYPDAKAIRIYPEKDLAPGKDPAPGKDLHLEETQRRGLADPGTPQKYKILNFPGTSQKYKILKKK